MLYVILPQIILWLVIIGELILSMFGFFFLLSTIHLHYLFLGIKFCCICHANYCCQVPHEQKIYLQLILLEIKNFENEVGGGVDFVSSTFYDINMGQTSFEYIFKLSTLIILELLMPSESCRKKLSSLEKERQDFQSTIEALQEGKYANIRCVCFYDIYLYRSFYICFLYQSYVYYVFFLFIYTEKKVLQSKLRKASASGKSIDVIKTPASKKDMSTSTEDLGNGISFPVAAYINCHVLFYWTKIQLHTVGGY